MLGFDVAVDAMGIAVSQSAVVEGPGGLSYVGAGPVAVVSAHAIPSVLICVISGCACLLTSGYFLYAVNALRAAPKHPA